MSKDVFRKVHGSKERSRYSYMEPSSDKQPSALEWMDDAIRARRVKKLEKQLPPTLKTEVRLGDVKAADASRDVAEARSKFCIHLFLPGSSGSYLPCFCSLSLM